MLKDELFGRHLQVMERDCQPGGPDQLTRELQHFVDCVRKGNQPRVSGEEGRDAIALASRVLESIHAHHWEGESTGPAGPSHLPKPVGAFFVPPAREAAA
jgi:predicted dehydrogenase